MLTLDEAVRARHSVRNFSNKPVDAAMLRKILDAGRLAPSAKNRQPWRFTVATDAQREAAADLLAAQAGKERAADSTVGATAAESGVYDEFRYTRIRGGVSVTAYCGSSARVAVPARVAGAPVLSLGKNMFRANERVREVIVPEGVTCVGDGAFAGMKALRQVELADSVLSLGVAAFRGCASLEHIRLPRGLTKLEEALFRECISLRECTVPPGVTEFGEAVFRGCVSLRWVDMPSVLRMTEGAFYGCAALRRLRVSPLLEGAEEGSFCTCPLLDAVVSGIRFRGGKAEKP